MYKSENRPAELRGGFLAADVLILMIFVSVVSFLGVATTITTMAATGAGRKPFNKSNNRPNN
jgi:hypothetical protein